MGATRIEPRGNATGLVLMRERGGVVVDHLTNDRWPGGPLQDSQVTQLARARICSSREGSIPISDDRSFTPSVEVDIHDQVAATVSSSGRQTNPAAIAPAESTRQTPSK